MFPLERIQEITPRTRAQLSKRGITTVEDLATCFPRTYYDFREVTPIRALEYGQMAMVEGTVVNATAGQKSNSLTIRDREGNRMQITWFHTEFYFNQYEIGDKACFCGRVTDYRLSWSMTNPILCGKDSGQLKGIYPVYPKYGGIAEKTLLSGIRAAIGFLAKNRCEPERDRLAVELCLMDYPTALRTIHKPQDNESYKFAHRRIAFESIFDFYEGLKRRDAAVRGKTIGKLGGCDVTADFINHRLPFQLTEGQLRAARTITRKCLRGERLDTIISGDVGCGKTIVALIAAILMAENGFQTVIAVPTVVLARQHHQTMSDLTKGVLVQGRELEIGLLTGETGKKERKKLLSDLAAGEIDVLIGTHAVISPEVSFSRLGLTVVDEEHKFGVGQKAALESLESAGAHHISMTATPIPRSIAKAVYTNATDVLQIRDKPKGRKPVLTQYCHRPEEAFDRIRSEVALGKQAYIICPFIEQSADEKSKDVASLERAQELFGEYLKKYPAFTPKIASISREMKPKEVQENIDLFAAGQADVLFSTTIVEVGVDVPNATVICIMSASRFGLSSLHQLRGRVGRSSRQSYCMLVDERRDEKINILCSTSDGFEIAEKDLALRGPGDLLGEEQAGDNKVIDIIASRPKLSARVKGHFFPCADGVKRT